jgi:hypothetical protein
MPFALLLPIRQEMHRFLVRSDSGSCLHRDELSVIKVKGVEVPSIEIGFMMGFGMMSEVCGVIN